MATRGSYVHYLYGRIIGGIPILFLCNFLRKLMVSNKKIHRALRTHTNSYEQVIPRNFSIFTIYQNYTLALTLNTNTISISIMHLKYPYLHIF